MNTLKELFSKFKNLKLAEKIVVIELTISLVIAIGFAIVKLIPFIVVAFSLMAYAYFGLKEKKIKEQKTTEMNLHEQYNLLCSHYIFIAEQLVNILHEYNNLFGLKVSTPSSIICTTKSWYIQQDKIFFYRFLVECNSDKKIDYEEFRVLLNNRLSQETFDQPIWIPDICRKGNYLQVVATTVDKNVYNFRENFERHKQMKYTRVKTDLTDNDF